jgi:hypothetical protein
LCCLVFFYSLLHLNLNNNFVKMSVHTECVWRFRVGRESHPGRPAFWGLPRCCTVFMTVCVLLHSPTIDFHPCAVHVCLPPLSMIRRHCHHRILKAVRFFKCFKVFQLPFVNR